MNGDTLASVQYFIEALQQAVQLIFPLDVEVADSLWRSLRVSSIATFLASLLAIPLAGLIALNEFKAKRFVVSVFSTMMALPTVVVGLFFYGLFTRRGALGSLDLLYTESALIAAEVVLSFPIITRLAITALHGVDVQLRQSLRTLGANNHQILLLTMREAFLGISIAVVTGYGRAISEVGAAMIVGGNIKGSTRTLTTSISLETSKGEFSTALAMGLLLLVVFFAVILVLNLLLLRLDDDR